jgi:L-rhamnose isomerase
MTDQRSNINIQKAYQIASEKFAEFSVSTDNALEQLSQIALSIHVWQGDDVGGFENTGTELGGGLAVTGNYPGKARTADELRMDLDLMYSLLPGSHRLSLHAIYGEFEGKKVERDEIEPKHFKNWVDWAKANNHGLDFNPTLFAHKFAEDGFTLSSKNSAIRQFWIDHCVAARKIGAYLGKELGSPCINNIWIPDGYKDTPVDRKTPRELLVRSLDDILSIPIDKNLNKDAVEGKLFGIGAESYTTGSHEFYLGYAVSRGILLCLDSGHFHPTETISDKISAVLQFIPEILLHVSRGVRWDSDHVVSFSDDLETIALEIVRGGYIEKVHIGLDYFDASINRLAAWTIGARNTLKALLFALLEPFDKIQQFETNYDYTQRLLFLEEFKTLPFGLVWDYYCHKNDVPIGINIMTEIRNYEQSVLVKRG